MARRRKTNQKYLCVRCDTLRKDSRLTSLFLCKECFIKLKKTAFNNYDPVYCMDPMEGYCLYCNQRKRVNQYFYFLCETCERVVHSYGRELAARNYILELWNKYKQEYSLNIDLQVEDPVVPMSVKAHRQYKKQTHPRPDFIAKEEDTILFAIEMKTGRSSINEMSKFQLDKSDCDDIIAFLKISKYRIPTFLVHVQVLEDYDPPTTRFIGKGAWWTSLFDMEQAFMEMKMRFRERRPAVYYKVDIFRDIDELPNYILQGGLEKELKLLKERIPILYRSEK